MATPTMSRAVRLRRPRRCGRSVVGRDSGTWAAGSGGACGVSATNSTPLTGRSPARRLDDVAGAADGVDQLRLDGVDLLAQVADVELDDVGLALEVVLPHPVEDLRLGQDHPLVAH